MRNIFIEDYHRDAVQSFRNYKKLVERADQQAAGVEKGKRIEAAVDFLEKLPL